MRAIATLLLIAAAVRPALAQTAPGVAGGSPFVSASLSMAKATAPDLGMTTCPPPGNRGIFCGSVSGATLTVAGEAGVFLSRYVALSAEGSLSKSRHGFANYDQQSHTDYNVTTASFDHSMERGISGLIFGHIPIGERGAAIEPVVGGTLVYASDRLSSQVRVAGAAGFPRVTSNPIDAKTSYTGKGFILGLGGATRPAAGVSFVGSVRARWLNWPQVLTQTYRAFSSSGATQLVPVSVGRWTAVVSAGVRWTGRK